jgi:hypothetical protein
MNDITKKLQKMVKSKKTPNVVTKCGTGKYTRRSRSSTSVESYISFSTSDR